MEQANLFTGWVDVDLTAQGAPRPRAAGSCWPSRAAPDVAAHLAARRAIRTGNSRSTSSTALDPGAAHWRLNERHYGELQGKDKAADPRQYGDEQFMTLAPRLRHAAAAIDRGSEYDQAGDPRYAAFPDVPQPSASTTSSTGCCRTGTTPSCPTSGGRDRPGRRARQLAARPGEAPRRHLRRGDPGLNIPTGTRSATSSTTSAPGTPAASTSIPRPLPPRSRRSRTRVADVRRAAARVTAWRARR